MRCPRKEQPRAGRRLGLARLMDEVSLINRASVSPRSPIGHHRGENMECAREDGDDARDKAGKKRVESIHEGSASVAFSTRWLQLPFLIGPTSLPARRSKQGKVDSPADRFS